MHDALCLAHPDHSLCFCSLLPDQGLEKDLEKADAAFEENRDRINIMQEHLHNVQQELKYTQSRVGGWTRFSPSCGGATNS